VASSTLQDIAANAILDVIRPRTPHALREGERRLPDVGDVAAPSVIGGRAQAESPE